MNSSPRRLTPAATLLALLLLASGCGAAPTAPAVQGHARLSTPCAVSADRVDDFRRAGQPLAACIRTQQPASAAHRGRCLPVADRIQQWIDLGIPLPRCVRDLERAYLRPGP
jgi:hypothetical protein